MMSKIIVLENVTKCYLLKNKELKERAGLFNFISKEEFYALKGISLTIDKGASVGIIGKNGAGKTMLLKIISGIVYPTSGQVIVKKPVSAIFEFGDGFHPELTGMENIFLYGSLLGIRKKEIKRNLGNIVSFSELSDFVAFKLKHYSTGMRIRLAFSVISTLSPEMLILDEALSAGDQGFVQKVNGKIHELQHNGVTTLISSHSTRILKEFCNRGVVLHKGCLVFDGEIEKAINYYEKEILIEDPKALALSS